MKRLLLATAGLFMGLSAVAQGSYNPAQPYGTGQDSINCRKNIAFFKTYAKSNNYQDAYDFWQKAYKACPAATKDIYIVGANILKWKVENAKTDADKQKYIDELMTMYDNRIKYFGDDPDTGKDYILGSKASDYINLMGSKADIPMVYDWLKGIVAEKKGDTDPLTLSLYAFSSMNKMLKDDSHKEQYINDYMAVSGYFDAAAEKARAAGDEEAAAMYAEYKTGADTNFAASGAASCEMMEKIYSSKLDENKDNKEYLQTVVTLLTRIRCQESPVYYKAAEYVYHIEPSANAAIGIARQAMAKKQYDRANKFYEEAIKLSQSSDERSEAYYNMAVMAYQQKSYSRSRQLCNQAMQERSNFGAPLLLIAQMYAATAPSIYPDDPILQRIVYCLVVDKCERAKSIDGSVTAEANRLIGMYRKHYPNKEDVFMHPDINAGQSFTIGGWIGETTTVRTN